MIYILGVDLDKPYGSLMNYQGDTVINNSTVKLGNTSGAIFTKWDQTQVEPKISSRLL